MKSRRTDRGLHFAVENFLGEIKCFVSGDNERPDSVAVSISIARRHRHQRRHQCRCRRARSILARNFPLECMMRRLTIVTTATSAQSI